MSLLELNAFTIVVVKQKMVVIDDVQVTEDEDPLESSSGFNIPGMSVKACYLPWTTTVMSKIYFQQANAIGHTLKRINDFWCKITLSCSACPKAHQR